MRVFRAAAATTIVLLVSCTDAAPPEETGPLLEAPLPGEGFQITTDNFPVDPGNEVQDCYFYRVRDLAAAGGFNPDESFLLHRVQIAYRVGSHHMNIFRVRTILDLDPANGAIQRSLNGTAACSKSVNWADWPLIANSQSGGETVDWTYPDGVANELQPDEWIMLQTHYVNATTQVTPGGGRVDVNMWAIPRADVQYLMGTIFATKQSIRICQSNPTPTFSGTCNINSPTPVHIIGANGHFHSRGREFGMYAWDGTTATTPPETDRFYLSDRWDDPPMAHSPELFQEVPNGGGIWYTCSYEWQPPPASLGCEGLNRLDQEIYGTPTDQLDCCYTFGNTVDRAEHCNVFGYYYPKTDDVNCF